VRLELQGITKRFPGVVANDAIDLIVEPGEVHGLLGENGAGKSTLMNILYGLYTADEGRILVDDQAVDFDDPGDAIAAGIGMVHQHFMLVPVFTVAENIMLGNEPLDRFRRFDRRAAHREVERVAEEFGLPVDPGAVVEDLPVGLQQRVEILKALSRDAKLLILDEPTAVLTPQEADGLFESIRGFRAAGRSVIFISHKLREHLELADRITVLRRGRAIGTVDAPSASPQDLANMMVGRPVVLVVDRGPAEPKHPVLTVEGLEVLSPDGHRIVDGVDLTVHSGEIVAIAGVEGNGQTPLVEAITGMLPIAGGRVLLGDRDLTGLSRKEVLRSGVGHIPEDRAQHGLVGSFSIADNLVLNLWDDERFASGRTRRFDAVDAHAERMVEDFDVRTPSIATKASSLSGGNQQKVIVAREFDRPIDLLVAAQPTRGVDVGSIEYIHRQLVAKRDAGVGILLVSSELDEVIALADRVAVMFRGRLVGPFPTPVSKAALGLMMAGVDPEEAMREDAA
jgi:general nucleoside transport system ATP-binding protein